MASSTAAIPAPGAQGEQNALSFLAARVKRETAHVCLRWDPQAHGAFSEQPRSALLLPLTIGPKQQYEFAVRFLTFSTCPFPVPQLPCDSVQHVIFQLLKFLPGPHPVEVGSGLGG